MEKVACIAEGQVGSEAIAVFPQDRWNSSHGPVRTDQMFGYMNTPLASKLIHTYPHARK